MSDKEQPGITTEEHRRQIDAYSKEFPTYKIFAEVLKRILERACTVSFPEAFVQSRPKTTSSFAEKCVRRFDRYPDAVNQMTDLCGARVILQTVEQVTAVRQFIEDNFKIHEKDDKGLLLSDDKFGYRDMHYIIQLKADHAAELGISPEERRIIGSKKAEVQVRTWLQHAWADTLHDRIYKNSLPISTGIRRTGALLAALMEEGDRNYNIMANELDGMVANYTAFARKDDVVKEIAVQELILSNELNDDKKPAMSLKLARLLEACGDYDKVITLLDPYQNLHGANRCELIQCLGFALCKVNRKDTKSDSYGRGCRLLEEALAICSRKGHPFAPHLRKRESLHARTLFRLGWAFEKRQGKAPDARECRRQAYEHEPANPYYLADMLGYEMYFMQQKDLLTTLRANLREAIATCRAHASAGIELPYAYFTTGRLCLLIDQPREGKGPLEALGYYARGIKHYLDGIYCFPADIVEEEIEWLERLHHGVEPPAKYHWAEELLAMCQRIATAKTPESKQGKVLIMTGGAVSMTPEIAKTATPLVMTALEAFSGMVSSGGTVTGLPGIVGEVSAELAHRKAKNFELVGYIPETLPQDAPKDSRYDRFVICGTNQFSPEQILRGWQELLNKGINPRDVLLLGFGGGPLSALEYRIALAFGASVAVVAGTGGDADNLVQDELWSKLPNLLPLPLDAMSVRAFIAGPEKSFPDNILDEMARAFHENYVAGSTGKLPDTLKPWPKLPDTFKKANTEQARYAIQILEACGFGVREAVSPVIFQEFSAKEIERMAEMEHGRWNLERLRDGWRLGPRDDARKLHDCLVSWKELTDEIKGYDCAAVCNYPTILAKAGLEVYRK